MGMLGLVKGLFKARQQRVDLKERFELIARSGQGSMSKVYRARDRLTGRAVALKILDKKKTQDLNDRLGDREKPSEGALAASLDHPNVVRTFEHGVSTKDEQFLVMEFIEGSGLEFYISVGGRQLEEKGLPYVLGTARALEYFHAQNLIHRDVCPRNVLIDSDEQPKLIDFGLSVPNTPEFRRPGNRTGTASYMAPELIRRQPTDERIDIFSFAVTAYEALGGSLPWPATESMKAALQHINTPPRDIREMRPSLDTDLAEVIMKGLRHDPDRRWQSMGEFRAALESHV